MRGGTVVTAEGEQRTDMGITESHMTAVAPVLQGRETIDTSGRVVHHARGFQPLPTERKTAAAG